MQTHQFPVGGDLLAGNIAHAFFPTEQSASNGHSIEPVGLGSQALLLVKVMGLPWMQEAHLVPLLLQLMVQILMVTRGCLHPNDDLVGSRIQLRQFLFPHLPSLFGISEVA